MTGHSPLFQEWGMGHEGCRVVSQVAHPRRRTSVVKVVSSDYPPIRVNVGIRLSLSPLAS